MVERSPDNRRNSMLMGRLLLFALLVPFLMLPLRGGESPAPGAPPSPTNGTSFTTDGLVGLVTAVGADMQAARRFYDLAWSELCLNRLDTLRAEWARRLTNLSFETFGVQERIDALLLQDYLRQQQR